MVQMTKLERKPAIHILLYGPPKTGKTRLAGSLAEYGYFLDWMDYESGSNTLFSNLSRQAQEKINLVRVPDTKEWPVGIETALKVSKFPQKPLKICDMHGKIDCPLCSKKPEAVISTIDFTQYTDKHILVHDSLTQLSRSSMHQITKNQEDLYKPQRDDYMNQGQHLEMLLGNIQNCPYNIICISHEISHETEEGKEKIFPVAGTRNFSRNTAKYFDEVIYMDIFNRGHRATSSTTHLPLVLTGSRSGVVLETNKEPSLLPIFLGDVGKTQQQAAKELLERIKT